MPSSRSCRSSYDCIVKIKGVTMRPILFSQLMRSDGEGAMNPEELFADDRSPASEQERVHEDELHSLMRSILDWAISFLSESSQGTIRAIYFEGKTVKQHSEEEYVTVYAIYKRLARSYPVIKEIVLEELRGSTTRRAPSSRPCSGLAVAMRNEQVEAVQGEMLHRDGELPRCRASFGRMLLQRLAMSLAHDADQSACACPTPGSAASRKLCRATWPRARTCAMS